jgi:hypothetical protein
VIAGRSCTGGTAQVPSNREIHSPAQLTRFSALKASAQPGGSDPRAGATVQDARTAGTSPVHSSDRATLRRDALLAAERACGLATLRPRAGLACGSTCGRAVDDAISSGDKGGYPVDIMLMIEIASK